MPPQEPILSHDSHQTRSGASLQSVARRLLTEIVPSSRHGIYRFEGQYIGIMASNISPIPVSDSRFGRNLAIQSGALACQSISDGLPVTRYP